MRGRGTKYRLLFMTVGRISVVWMQDLLINVHIYLLLFAILQCFVYTYVDVYVPVQSRHNILTHLQ